MAESNDPLDFSFTGLDFADDLTKCEPRENIVKSPRRAIKKKAEQQGEERHKSSTKAMRLGNNDLVDVKGLPDLMDLFLENPDDVEWLDLSFNSLEKIDEIICRYKNLKILYLHGNKIRDINEIKKLEELPNLQKLTLHGNPFVDQNYRNNVLAQLKQLKVLDTCAVSRADRKTAECLGASNTGKKKKIKKED